MASRPSIMPEGQSWLIVSAKFDGTRTHYEIVESLGSKRDCLEWILQVRMDGDTASYYLYGPDSCHEAVTSNKIVWEKSNG